MTNTNHSRLSDRINMLRQEDSLKKKLEVKHVEDLDKRWEEARPWLYYKRDEYQVKQKGARSTNKISDLKMWSKVIA